MKKLSFIILFLTQISILSQNIQLHYELADDRKHFTSTIEMFKPDEYGATFFFFDIEYNRAGNKSASLAYFEIARYFNLPLIENLSATIQYNDGVAPWGPLGHVWLGGLSYPINFGSFSIGTEFLYRAAYGSVQPDFQFTATWIIPFLENKFLFAGFVDLYTQDESAENKMTVFIAEPQMWFNLDKHISLGGEVEVSQNFLSKDKVEFKPTLAVMWTF